MKHLFTKIFTLVVVLLMATSLGGCKKEEDVLVNIQEPEEQIMVGDVLKYCECFGKTAKELELNEDEFYVYVDGQAFGVDCRASLMFFENLPDNKKGLSEINIYFKNKDFPQATDFFEEEFKGIVNVGMEPYVASNGGAVEWYIYEDENYQYKYSSGSENDYFTLSITKNENPGYMGNLVLGKFKGLESNETDSYEVKVNSYDNGILNITLINKMDEEMVLEELMLYEMEDNHYVSMFTMGMRLYDDETVIDAKETKDYEINLRRYGKLKPNQYIVKHGDVNIYFALKEDK